MITIKHLSHEFVVGKKGKQTVIPILKDISLEVKKGEEEETSRQVEIEI